MSSFLDRLKKKNVLPSNPDDQKANAIATQNTTPPPANQPPADQLKVDIYQTQHAIIIYTQIAGSSIRDFSVAIEGDGDVVTIKGARTKPEGPGFEHPAAEGMEKVLEECSWGKFYRQIILPAQVDPPKTVAKMRDGVLMLLLPLKESGSNGVKIDVIQV